MGLQTYVGARYVPRFMGTYDPTQIYEALDIVDNGSGTSYISKIPTPAGTPLTNTDYWAVYGAASGAIINLQNQIDDMRDGDIPGSLQNQIDKTVKEIPDRTFIFMGDSYDTIQPTVSWIDNAAGYLGLDSSHYFKRSAGGRGFYPTNPALTWTAYLQANPVTDPDAITDIVVCGGANDCNAPAADLLAGMQAFNTYVRATFPNLKHIYLGFIGWQQTANRPKYLYEADNYKKFGAALGWDILNGVNNIMKNPAYIDLAYTDYQHPTVAGVEELALGIANAIKTGDYETYAANTIVYSANSSNVTPTGNNTFYEDIINGMISFTAGNQGYVAAQDLSGDFELNTCDPDESGMNLGTFYPVRIWQSSAQVDSSGLLYFPTVGSMHLILADGVTVQNGTGFRLRATHITDIVRK